MERPLSPILLAGLALPPYAERVIEPIANRLARKSWAMHRKSFDRLTLQHQTVFAIDPVDLPFVVCLKISDDGPTVRLGRRPSDQATATIRGSLKSLVQLTEGKIDGDALFFSRDLEIEGDTEAVVALRNALDDADIDLASEFSLMFGPLAKPMRDAKSAVEAIDRHLRSDLHVFRDALLAPLATRINAQARNIEALDQRLGRIELKLRKTKEGAL